MPAWMHWDADRLRYLYLPAQGFPIVGWRHWSAAASAGSGELRWRHKGAPGIKEWIPVPPSSPPALRICTPLYEEECESSPTDKQKIMVLAAGPTGSDRV